MKSIQTKILCLILSSVILSTAAVVMVSIVNYGGILDENAEEIMQLRCSEKTQEIDGQLISIEQSVNTIYQFAITQIDGERLWQEEGYLEEYTQKVKEVAVNAAENTFGAVTVYYRFNPEMTNPREGFFMVQNQVGDFVDYEVTDFSKYERDDVEHVGWYYIPVDAGRATWISPYYNRNLDILMISYVCPIYEGDATVGVIGMDIELDALFDSVKNVSIYDSGYAFLMDEEGNMIYHKDFPGGIQKEDYTEEQKQIFEKNMQAHEDNIVVSYQWNGQEKHLAAQRLRNGMIFSVCVPKAEIVEPQQRMLQYSLCLIGLILLVAILITIQVTKVMVRPLKQLTEAARKIANDDLEVSIDCKAKDEVGILAQSFQQTAEHLRQYIEYINRLAYTDVLTTLKNKAAYEECVEMLDKKIAEGNAEFTVIVMDINDLKKVNDTYGHEKGDILIQNAAKVMKKVWGSEFVYRTGGDEFTVILAAEAKEQCQNTLRRFEEELAGYNRENNHQELHLQIAVGTADYEQGTDASFSDVFRRADALMYKDKEQKKKLNGQSI
ncbi:MAG: diguanylate cyclase [Lachnospiraceae bacterium]